jgi:hypothetical protein
VDGLPSKGDVARHYISRLRTVASPPSEPARRAATNDRVPVGKARG